MRVTIRIDNDAGVQQIVGIGQLLQPPHDLVSLASPLGLDERSHVATSAMFGFQGTVVTLHHQLHYIVDKVRILIDYRLIVKALGDNKVQVSVLGVTEDDGVIVGMLTEEASQIVGSIGQRFDGKRNVFDDDGGPALAHRTDRRETCLPESATAGPVPTQCG